MTDNDLTIKARAVARCLSYNGNEHQAAAKHLLHEMAHRIDTLDVRAHKKSDGLLLINGIGKARFATIKERIIYMALGILPKKI